MYVWVKPVEMGHQLTRSFCELDHARANAFSRSDYYDSEQLRRRSSVSTRSGSPAPGSVVKGEADGSLAEIKEEIFINNELLGPDEPNVCLHLLNS